VVNLSELSPQWNWLSHAFESPAQAWRHVSSENVAMPGWLPRVVTVRRMMAGREAVALAGRAAGVLVSHGPRPTMYGSLLAGRRYPRMRHLAYSFNFTDLPRGGLRRLMARAYRSVDRFVVFSTLERSLYADYFGIAPERIDMLHWAVKPPQAEGPPLHDGPYLCALGSQARDYRTLFDAMRLVPAAHLVIVVAKENLLGLQVPPNVTVYTEIPFSKAMNVLRHSAFMALPLRDAAVPCGHVTAVAAMHMGRAVIATDSAGLRDYVNPDVNALLCGSGDSRAWAAAIERLLDNPLEAEALGTAGQTFANRNCVEQRVIDYFHHFLQEH
jgi:glycosyltransferase involved in cell wall biosynthesis